MKKVNLLMTVFVLMAMLFGTTVSAQNRIDLGAAKSSQKCANLTKDGFSATFSFSNIETGKVSTERGEFSYILMDETYPSGRLGEPSLPAAHQLLSIPIGAKDVTVNVKSFSTTVYNLADYGVKTITPQQPMLRKDQRPEDIPFAYNEKVYNTRGYAARDLAQFEILGTMRGIQVGSLTINPIQYDAVNNSIKVFNDIEVEVSYGSYDKTASDNEFARTFSPYFANIYRQMFNWRDDIYDEHPDLWQSPVKMLVIANRMFEDAMQPWISWKTTKGFYMDVNYTDEIGTTSTAIKSFIQEKYNADAPTFIIIFGDRDQVPESAIGSQTNCVTDLYYESVDGDEFPDMFHSRMCAETVAQMESIIEKSLVYEQYTMPDPGYLSNVLLIAGEDHSGWGVTVGRPAIWYATHYYYNTDHGFTNVHEYSHGTYDNCYDNLNTGVGFANYTAHGSNTSWADPELNISGVNNLTNTDKYFLAMGNCCVAADWGYDGTCFGEAMIRAEKKAAYAYIGACPSTYWLNDYYFAVGATNHANGTMPTMEETSMGCYDAIWMDNAYNTIAAIPFIGNLASNYAEANNIQLHKNTLYCWQAYHTLGDGSIMPFRVQPTANQVSHMNIVPIGLATYEVSADAGSYVAISKDGVLHGVGLVDESGSVTINLDPITSNGDVTICVTHPQRIPIIEQVPAAALNGAYVIIDSYTLKEGNEQVDYGETFGIDAIIKNVGTVTANNLTVTLSTESEYIEILNGSATIASLTANQTSTIEDFQMKCAVSVPDKTNAIISVNITNGTDTWESKFNIMMHAPKLEIVEANATDALLPGGNGTLKVKIANKGTSAAHNINLDIFSSSNDLSFAETTFIQDNLDAGEAYEIDANFTIASGVEIGTAFEVSIGVHAGHYGMNTTTFISVGQIIEDFETGDFTKYDWVMSPKPWTIDSTVFHNGSYAAKSGVITHSEKTSMSLSVDVVNAGEMSFWCKVSSEKNYDKLKLYLDGSMINEWSGESEWTKVIIPVTAGSHTFKWSYEKDYSMSNGQDCAWIDDIQFPPTSVVTILNPVANLKGTVSGNTVTLQWDASNRANTYEIRRNGEVVATQANTTFSEEVADGVYTYCVVARTEAGACSAPAYTTVNVGLVNVEEVETVSFEVYPNPSNGMFNLNVKGQANDVEYCIFNHQGQTIVSKKFGTFSGIEQINLDGVAKGIYFLRIINGTQVKTQKIVIE